MKTLLLLLLNWVQLKALKRFNKNCSHFEARMVSWGYANDLPGSAGTNPGLLR